MLVVAQGDWPVVALGLPLDEPVAVVVANRVVACSPAARRATVHRGLSRREAQSRCADLVVVERDPAAEVRHHEPVLTVLDDICPRVEILRPGVCAFPTRGPSRYFGGDEVLARRVHELLADVTVGPGNVTPPVYVGIADGVFAARLAARSARPVAVVAAGRSRAFLASRPVDDIVSVGDGGTGDAPVEVWKRLGVRTLGDLAALPATDVLGRFGEVGATAHRLARGLDRRPPDLRDPPADMTVTMDLDPPLERIEAAAFVARTLADELSTRLGSHGSGCGLVEIAAETEHGETLVRLWRGEGSLGPAAIADRVRWQLDGWLTGPPAVRPTGGLARLGLTALEVGPAVGRQLGFWGSQTAVVERVTRAVARVQGIAGVGTVSVPERRGGRDPAEMIVRVAAEAVDLVERERRAVESSVLGSAPSPVRPPDTPPWPGALPPPSPAVVHPAPVPVRVLDEAGEPVAVSGRGLLSDEPATIVPERGPPRSIASWAGPWPVEERWWDPRSQRRRARFQMILDDGAAMLVVLEGGEWYLAASYD